jgi:hypothetical protein
VARRKEERDPDVIRTELQAVLGSFDQPLARRDLRKRVQTLVHVAHLLRDFSVSLVPELGASSAKDRILQYLTTYPGTVISGDELAVISGVSEYARRLRELRADEGWPIYSGKTAREMARHENWGDLDESDLARQISAMQPDDYVLLGEPDGDAARRWRIAGEVRRLKLPMRDRLLAYLRRNVGRPLSGEELKYVANGEAWPSCLKELRSELGWPIATRLCGRPDLPVGVYLLESDSQVPPHDRNIRDSDRIAAIERDGFACRHCGWKPRTRLRGDPRTLLELHRVEPERDEAPDTAEVLLTLCNVHHEELHDRGPADLASTFTWLGGDMDRQLD